MDQGYRTVLPSVVTMLGQRADAMGVLGSWAELLRNMRDLLGCCGHMQVEEAVSITVP